jgi:putative tricarboxylic transport membrane protein
MIDLLFSSVNFIVVGFIFFGVVFGILVSAIPGLTTTIGVVLLLPFTYYLESSSSLGMLMGVFVGGMAGGAIPAILINIPGNPASIVTNINGYPLAKSGRGDFALGLALMSSTMGALIGLIMLFLISPQLSDFALKFGAVEQFALVLLGLSLVSALSEKSVIKGYISMCLGLMIATVGLDPITAVPRYNFGTVSMQQGISFIPVMIGMFAIPTILESMVISKSFKFPTIDRNFSECIKGVISALNQIKNSKFNIIRSSVIGSIIGAIPGTGSAIAATLSYQLTKKIERKDNERMNFQGIISPEAANSAMSGGALIPMLTLGIPGDPVTAVMLGALTIHGLEPGPMMLLSFPEAYYGLLGSFAISILFLAILSFFGIPIFLKALRIKTNYIMPVIFVLCIIGSFALRNAMLDVWIMLIFGVIAFYMNRHNYPILPMILALILGKILEEQFRMSLIISLGDPFIFFKKPISLTLLLILGSFLTVIFVKFIKNNLNRKKI